MPDVTIYDQFGRPVTASKRPPSERRVLASAPVTESAREYVAAGLTPEGLAATFQKADAGDVYAQAELFEQIEEKDAHILAENAKRKNVILDVDFKITPASEDPRDIRVAEFCQDWQQNQEDWADNLICFQDAIGKGYAGLEMDWDVSEGQALPTHFDFIDQRRFVFTDEKNILSRVPRLITDEEMMGRSIPEWKVVFHQYGGKSGHPTRSGVFRVCAWMYLFKNYSIKDWLIFCEVFGMPLRVGTYSPGATPEDKAALKTALMSIASDAAGIISEATKIEFIQNKGTSKGELYEAMVSFCNAETSKALLGQTLSAEPGDSGSYSLGKVHEGVRMDLLRADGRAIAATIRNQILRPIVGFNFGFDTAVPKLEADFEEEEDLKAKVETYDIVLDRIAVPADWYRDELKIPKVKKGEETIGGGPVNAGMPGLSPVAAKARQIIAKADESAKDPTPADTLVRIGDKTLNSADMGALIKPLEALLDEVSSLEEYKERLAGMAGNLDTDKLGEFLARAMAVANLAGRFDA